MSLYELYKISVTLLGWKVTKLAYIYPSAVGYLKYNFDVDLLVL